VRRVVTDAPRRLPAAWWILLIGIALTLTAADTVLLGAAKGFLTHGFNTPRIGWAALSFLFLPASILLDVWLVLCLWLVAIPVLRRVVRSPVQRLLIAALVATGVPLGLAIARYNVFSILGGMFSIRQWSGRGSALVWDTLLGLPDPLLWSVGAGIAVLVALRLASWIERRHLSAVGGLDAPSARALLRGWVPLSAATLSIVAAAAWFGGELNYGIGRKISGRFAVTLIDFATDLDRDGSGLLSRPVDPAPFDSSVVPYAIDEPGNGVDEDGVAGDHPADLAWPEDEADPGATPPWQAHPHFLLVYLESFRYDLLEQETADGRPVTPFLRRLAGEGSASRHTYVHSPWTLESRSQLFSGHYLAEPGAPTLIDDFKSRGYTVAHFSGQDESYGGSEEVLGTARADRFYDARQDASRRTSRSTAPVSLQVSWRTLTERIDAFLAEWDGEGPLFLYANVVDTHFPYWHDENEDLLGVPPLRRSDIRASNADHVRAAYANTAANVDRAVEHIVASFRSAIGGADHAILVTADHGQALYHGALLGHGVRLDHDLTQVPLIVWRIGGTWPEPIGPTDLRGLILRNLGRARPAERPPRARFVADPTRRVFQYAPRIARPSFVALQGIADRVEYSFHRNRLDRIDAEEGRTRLVPAEERDLFERMIWRWESLRRRRAAPDEVERPGDD